MDFQKFAQGYQNGGLLGAFMGAQKPANGLMGLLGMMQGGGAQTPPQTPAGAPQAAAPMPNLGMSGPHPGMQFQPPNPYMPQQTMRDKMRNQMMPFLGGF